MLELLSDEEPLLAVVDTLSLRAHPSPNTSITMPITHGVEDISENLFRSLSMKEYILPQIVACLKESDLTYRLRCGELRADSFPT